MRVEGGVRGEGGGGEGVKVGGALRAPSASVACLPTTISVGAAGGGKYLGVGERGEG